MRAQKSPILVFVLLVVLLIPLLIQPAPVQAQKGSGWQDYVAPDGSFRLSYPSDWSFEVDPDDGAVIVSSRNTVILLYGPRVLAGYGLGDLDDGKDLVLEVMAALEQLTPQEMLTVDVEGRSGTLYSYLDQGFIGFVMGVPFSNGDMGLVDAYAPNDDLALDDATVMQIIASFDTGGGASGSLIDTLTHYGDPWQDAVEELEQRGVIPAGGSLVFTEDYAFFSGRGSFFTPLARYNPRTNIVMAGELTFNVGSTELETCTLGARIQLGSGTYVDAYIDIGLDNEGNVFYFDNTGSESTSNIGVLPLQGNPEAPHHFLIVLLDDNLSLYVDGELYFANESVQVRDGVYGVGLTGEGPAASCEGRDIWVVEVPYYTPGLCEISTGAPVNKRSGPGTTYSTSGQLQPGDSPEAVGYTTDDAGFTWWLLDDGTWVREDVVIETGDCLSVPDAFATPDNGSTTGTSA